MSDIIEALKTLNPEDDNHWTTDGLPRLDVLAELVGKGVKRSEVTDVAPKFNRQNTSLEKDTNNDESKTDEDPIQAESTQGEEAQEVEADEADELSGLEAAVKIAEAEIAEATKTFNAVQANLQAAIAKRDALLEERSKNVHPNQNQIDIMEFLEGQKRLREKRFNATTVVTGNPKAPIDIALGRKTGFGKNRPALPVKQG